MIDCLVVVVVVSSESCNVMVVVVMVVMICPYHLVPRTLLIYRPYVVF